MRRLRRRRLQPAQAATKYDANDEVRVLNWNDREWRDRYWREMNLRKPRQ